MLYRVAFQKRFQSDGAESTLDPSSELDVYLPDGVVADKEFVERFEPASQHSQEVLDEDDAFMAMASTEVWEYDVVDERRSDFEDAIRNSQMVMDFEVIDETPTDPDEVTGVNLGDGESHAPEQARAAAASRGTVREGLGVRGVDDGPGGQPTVDTSAGEMTPSRPYLNLDDAEGIASDGGGGIDDLTIVSADDPSLGLTEFGETGPDDWAAATGPARVPDRGLQTDNHYRPFKHSCT